MVNDPSKNLELEIVQQDDSQQINHEDYKDADIAEEMEKIEQFISNEFQAQNSQGLVGSQGAEGQSQNIVQELGMSQGSDAVLPGIMIIQPEAINVYEETL